MVFCAARHEQKHVANEVSDVRAKWRVKIGAKRVLSSVSETHTFAPILASKLSAQASGAVAQFGRVIKDEPRESQTKFATSNRLPANGMSGQASRHGRGVKRSACGGTAASRICSAKVRFWIGKIV